MLEMYPKKHWKESMQFQGTPAGYREPAPPAPAPSPQATPPPAATTT